MKFKRFLFICCFLIIVLLLGTVSASDSDDADILNIHDESLNQDMDELIYVGESQTTQKTQETGSFEDLEKEINNTQDVLVLNKSYSHSGSTTSGIVINKSITVDGQGYSIDANNAGRIFQIKSNNVILKNINFINAKSDTYVGGAILWIGNTAKVINCSFINCTAPSAGGAIALKGNNTTIISTIFKNNEAFVSKQLGNRLINDYSSEDDYFPGLLSTGGAVFVDGQELSIIDSIFENNKVLYNKDYFSRIPATISNTTFTLTDNFKALSKKLNSTDDLIILDRDYKVETRYPNGILINKSVTIDGKGHILDGEYSSRIFTILSDNVTLKNIKFFNGRSCTYDTIDGIGGGAIYWQGANGKLINCTFIHNQADDPYFHLETERPENDTTINGGGAIVWKGDNGLVQLCDFTYNNAHSNYYNVGGAILWLADNGRVESSKFQYNGAWRGGALYYLGNSLIINSSNFTQNLYEGIDYTEINGQNISLINSNTSNPK